VAEIAGSTGFPARTLYSWRHRWKLEGQLAPASSKAPEQWSAADKLAAVIQASVLSGADLGCFCRHRGWQQADLGDRRPPRAKSACYLALNTNDYMETLRYRLPATAVASAAVGNNGVYQCPHLWHHGLCNCFCLSINKRPHSCLSISAFSAHV
jgi:hypothetical protein